MAVPLATFRNADTAAFFEDYQVGDGVFQLPGFTIVRTELYGEPVFFTVAARRDLIQKKFHANGIFYEDEELEMIRRAFAPGGCYVDIGANVGNHALFVAKFLSPSDVVVVEPNPVAYKVLFSNVVLNNLDDAIDMSWLGFGISETASASFGLDFNMKNVGAGRLVEGAGDIATVRGDDVVGDRSPSLIKLDVEGMEMEVLRSLENTVARCRPRIFIEVDKTNKSDFEAWVAENNYAAYAKPKRYNPNKNFLLVHEEDESWSSWKC